ncbi:hypothetical protein DFO70_1523 [Cytobacillus firmus]|uniref:Uncharacterized protein n=2 Tax=Cytobacillus TaxID=2675230 RepID=A0A366JCZ3_CYTFI|nr:hypothetical protein DFO70_1523 [Cytobacillus firmus]TDX39606.1 hypothetical protein DFO72_110203 [Cytobacillus oceanisediminis]
MIIVTVLGVFGQALDYFMDEQMANTYPTVYYLLYYSQNKYLVLNYEVITKSLKKG